MQQDNMKNLLKKASDDLAAYRRGEIKNSTYSTDNFVGAERNVRDIVKKREYNYGNTSNKNNITELQLNANSSGKITSLTPNDVITVPTKEQEAERQNKYSEFTYEQLKDAINKTDSAPEKKWLENRANEIATSEQLQTEYNAINNDYNTAYDKIMSSNDSDENKAAAVAKLNEETPDTKSLQYLIEQKKEEENEKKYYYDIIQNDVRAWTIVQKYYNLQQFLNTNDAYGIANADEAVEHPEIGELTEEDRQKIENDFHSLANKGYDTEKFYKYYSRIKEREDTEEYTKNQQELAKKAPIMSSIGSVIGNTVGAFNDAGKYLEAGLDKLDGGDGYIDPNNTNVARAQAVRSAVSEDMGDLGKFLYNTGMSMADFTAMLPLNLVPGGQAASLAVLGTSAGVSSANTVIENGGSIENAISTGFLAGIAEEFFEKFSLGQLKAFKEAGADSVKNVVKNTLKGAFVEGSEEVGTSLANALTDQIINGDMSSLSLEYQNYIEQGYSESEAWQKTAANFASQISLDFAGGALSGGVLGGVTSTISYGGYKLNQNAVEKLQNKQVTEVGKLAMADENFELNLLVEEAKNSGNAKAVKLANSIERSIENNNGTSKISATDVGNLMYMLQTDKPNDNYTIVNTDKQEINNNNYADNGMLKTSENNAKDTQKTTIAFGEKHPRGISVTTNSGSKLNIMRIESSARDFGSADNNVILRTDKGALINAEDVIPNTPHFQQLFNYAKNFDTLGARTFVAQYETYVDEAKAMGKTPNIEDYTRAFDELYNIGKMGATYENVKNSRQYAKAVDTLGGIAYTAVTVGNNDVNVNRQDESNKMQKIRVPGESNSASSKMYIEKGSEQSVVATYEQLQLLQAVAEKTCRDVILTDNMEDGVNGKYENGKIYIRADLNENYMLPVALHEATHSIRESNPLEYQTLCNFVINYLVAKGESVNFLLDDIKIKWNDKALTRDEQLEELVCNTIMSIASNEKAINTALNIKENKTLLEKVADALKKIAKKINQFINENTTNFQAQAWLNDANAIEQLAEKFSIAAENAKNAETTATENSKQKNNIQKDVKPKYSIDKNFEKIYDRWDKKTQRFSFRVGTTSEVLKEIGIDNKKIWWDSTKILKIQKKHPAMIDDVIKQVPNILEHPIIVMKSLTNPDRVVALGDVYDSNNSPVLIALELNPTSNNGRSLNIIKIASAYGKDVNLQGLINKSDILYIEPNKKRTHNWLTVNRLQLPLPSTNYGFIKTIKPQNSLNVNNNDMQKGKENSSDIKYAIDDTINNWIGENINFDDKQSREAFDNEIKINPALAVNKVYKSAAKTAESGIKQAKDVKLDDKAYNMIARTVMQRYKINSKLNPNYTNEFSSQIKSFVEQVESGKYADFASVMETFIEDCKSGIVLSGDFDTNSMKTEREFVRSFIRNKTLIIRESEVEKIQESYGSVGDYRKQMFGKTNVALEGNSKSKNTYYIEDVLSEIEKEFPYLIEEGDYFDGFKRLEKLINSVLEPKFVNPYIEDFSESIEVAAYEMAFDCTAEIINAKAKQSVTQNNLEQKTRREIAKTNKVAAAEREALLKAKAENYKQKYTAEHEQRINQIKRMRKNLINVQESDLNHRKQLQKKIDHLQNIVDSKNKIISMGYDTIREQYEEGRTRTIYRERLGRMLDRMTKKLDGKANNNEYIPETLKGPILNVLSSFAADPGYYKNGNKKQIPGYFGEWKNIAQIGTRIEELTKAYEDLNSADNGNKSEYAFIDVNSLAFKEGTLKVLKQLSEQVVGKNIYELDASDLMAIYDTMQELDESLKNAVEIILDGQRVSIREAAEQGIAQTESVKFKKDVQKFNNTALNVLSSTGRKIRNSYVATHLDPVRYGRFLSGYHEDYVIYKLMEDLHEGDKKRMRIMQDAFTRVQAVTTKYDNKQLKVLQKDDVDEFDFKDLKTGKHVKISQGMLLAIYLTDRQADGHRHLVNENYNHYTVIPDLDMMDLGLNGKDDKAHRVRFSEADLRNIKEYIDSNEMLREIAGAVSEVYNTILANNINDVSMAKYGKRIATVVNYYPLQIYGDGAMYEKNFEAEFNDIRLKNRSFTKNRVRSYAPIMIDDVLKTFTKYVKSSAEYCGMLIPIENFKKVYNSSNDDVTLHEAIVDKFGSSAEHYIEKLMTDLQQASSILDNSLLNKAQGNFMGAKLLFNPGAAVKQLAAFPTAYRYFGVDNVTKAAAVGMQKIDFDTYSKYTPYLWYRKEGNGTIVGELSREMGFTSKLRDKVDLMSKMDRYVVGCLLYAAELHVEQTTDLQRGTDAFYKEVARQYEKCVDETQPNNMVTSKPQFIRNNVMRILSLNAFRSQNMAIANGVIDSFMEFAARSNDYNDNKNAETKAAKNAAAKKFVGSLIGAVNSSLLIGALTILANLFIWHKWDDFKDEEGNVTFKTLSKNFLDYAIESLAGTLAWGDIAYETICTLIDHDRFFGLQVMSIENINDGAEKIAKGDILGLATLAFDCLGFPAENLLRGIRSIVAYGNDILNGNGDIISKNNHDFLVENNTTYFNYIILRAKQNGETEKAEHFEEMWKDDLINKQGKTEEQATDTIKSKLVTALATSDDDIEAAALAMANGELETYESHLDKVIGYGFDSKDVKKAVDKVIKNVISDLKERGIEEKPDVLADLKEQGFNDKGAEYVYKEMQENTESESKESVSAFADTSEGTGVAYSYSDAFEALRNGETENYKRIKQYLIDEARKEEKDITSAMRSSSRTDSIWKEFIEASKNNDTETTHRLKEDLTNIYGSWSTATTYRKKYEKRMKEKEEKNNKK